MITITALGKGGASAQPPSSASSKRPPRALSHLIRIDSDYILLDLGAPEDLIFPVDEAVEKPTLDSLTLPDGELNVEAIAELPLDDAIQLLAPRISLLLLSHSTFSHVGLYAYAKSRLGLRCPTYATLPTAAMGRLVSLEVSLALASECDLQKLDKRPAKASSREGRKHRDIKGEEEAAELRNRCVPSREEIDAAFEGIRTLRYLQPTVLEGQLSSLSLTAHSAGHTLGGTVWKLRSPTSGTIVLAIDWNHVKERHIDGSGVIEGASAATVSGRAAEEATGTKRAEMLVTSGERIGQINVRRKDKDKKLLDMIHHTLTVSKSTLHLPLDASPRLLEVLLLLDQHWAFSYPHARFPLCLVSRTGKEVLERARTMQEWMGRNLQGQDDSNTVSRSDKNKRGAGRDNAHGPLEFRFLRIFTSLKALQSAIPDDAAKVVVTVGPSLLYGPSLRFFRDQVCGNSNNTVVLTQSLQEQSLAARLQEWWKAGQGPKGWDERTIGKDVEGGGKTIDDITCRERVPLEGAELDAYQEEQRLKKEREEQQKALMARSRRRLEADEEQEEESDDDDGSDDDEASDLEDDIIGGDLDGEGAGSRWTGRRRKAGKGDDEADGVVAGGEGDMTMLGSGLSHDIYLKGNAAQSTNFFGAPRGGAASQGKQQVQNAEREREARERHGVGLRYRTFPVAEKRKRVDAFGEVIDVSRWLTRGRKEREEEEAKACKAAEVAAATAAAQGPDAKRRRLGEEEAAALADTAGVDLVDEYANVPTKFVSETISLAIHCKIAWIDLEGLIDGRAMSIVLPQLAPRRLVLVNTPNPVAPSTAMEKMVAANRGGKNVTSTFIASLLAIKDFTREIFAPGLGEKVSVGAQVKSFDVRLGEGLMEATAMRSWEDWGLGWVQGKVFSGIGGDGSRANAGRGILAGITLEKPNTAIDVDASSGDGRAVGEGQNEVEGEAATGQAESSAPVNDPLRAIYKPAASSALVSQPTSAKPGTLFIGDVRLSKLKSLLSTTHRIPSEFGGSGMLVCGSAALAQVTGSSSAYDSSSLPASANQAAAAVTVRKEGERIVLEGNAGRTFWRVREAVYGMHASVGDT